MRKVWSAVLLATLVACGGGDTGTNTPPPPPPTPAAVASVSVSLAASSLTAGGTTQATATLRDAGGTTLTGRSVQWSSASPQVATVSGSGVVTAVAPGTTSISATSEGVTGSAQLTVTIIPVATVTVTAPQLQLTTGLTTQASATLRDAGGAVLTGRMVTWQSSNASVATVSGAGLVTAVAPGTVTIAATSEGVTGSIQLTVTVPPVATVTVTAPLVQLTIGLTTQASATLRDAGGAVLTGRTITWQSSAPSVATVDGNGLVVAVAAGTATISASSEGRSGAIQVTVAPPAVASVTVTPGNVAMAPGQVTPLSAVVRDASQGVLQDRPVTWSSSALSIATVSGAGVVTAVAPGSATITATSAGISGTAVVTVSNVAVASVTLNTASLTMQAGDVQVVIATPRDANSNPLSGRTVAWTSSNLNVVDGYVFADTAVITGLTVGSATITATVEGRSASILVSVIPPPVTNLCSQIAGASIIASDGQYLGRLTNRFDPQSAFNEFGSYGSPYQANSTNNRYGQYGSPYGSKSAWNPYASSPPVLVKNNVALAYYTVNTFKTPWVSPAYAATCNFP